MFRFAPFLAAASALALSGCGTGDGNEGADANGMPKSRTENGQLTARVQGVDLKVNLPPPIRRMTEDNDYLYPRVRMQRGGEAGRQFHSDDPPETLVAWYQAPARANRFSIGTVARDGPAFVLAGTGRSGNSFSVRLQTGAQGGTDGTLVVTQRN